MINVYASVHGDADAATTCYRKHRHVPAQNITDRVAAYPPALNVLPEAEYVAGTWELQMAGRAETTALRRAHPSARDISLLD